MSSSGIVHGTAVVPVQTGSMIFTTCGISQFTLSPRLLERTLAQAKAPKRSSSIAKRQIHLTAEERSHEGSREEEKNGHGMIHGESLDNRLNLLYSIVDNTVL